MSGDTQSLSCPSFHLRPSPRKAPLPVQPDSNYFCLYLHTPGPGPLRMEARPAPSLLAQGQSQLPQGLAVCLGVWSRDPPCSRCSRRPSLPPNSSLSL